VIDAEAREYAIDALGAIAGELHSGEFAGWPAAGDLADRVLAAAERLRDERDGQTFGQALDELVADVDGRLARLEETVDALGRRVIGGPPPAGVVPVDGPELDREPDAPLAGD
jgi:hypothetical protein